MSNIEIRKKLDDLHDQLHEIELNLLLLELENDFACWKRKEISGMDLQKKIHHFQKSQFKDLYNLYAVKSFADINAARCVEEGLIRMDQIDPDLHELILSKRKFLSE